MIAGILSTILLPKASKSLASGNVSEKERIAYDGTFVTSVLANILCIPFIFCSNEVICAYVGKSYSYLSTPLVVWLISVLYQIHSTPCNSLILATGKTFYIVISTAVSCFISMFLNILFCNRIGIFSAVVSYALYVFVVITAYYVFYYKKILDLSGIRVFRSFLIPTVLAFFSLFVANFIPFESISFWQEEIRAMYVVKCFIKTFSWGAIYFLFLLLFILGRKKYGKK